MHSDKGFDPTLEELAYAYAETSTAASIVINYVLLVIGGLIGGATNRSEQELARAPYFALTGVILASLSTFVAVEAQFLVPAMANGVLRIVLVLEFAALAATGFACARIAKARSRNACGHPGNAFLAFIPVANLWLLFTPRPAARPPAPGGEHALAGAGGVFLGLILSIGSQVLDRATAASAERRVTAAKASGALDHIFLHELLKSVAASETVPHRVDEVTQLTSVEAGETTLVYVFAVDSSDGQPSEELRTNILGNGCGIASLDRVIKAGATVTMIYRGLDGTDLMTIDMSSRTCPY